MATISNGVTTITPTVKISYADSYESRNIVHPLLGGGVAVTFGGTPKRTGTLELIFSNETDANTAYVFFRDSFVFQLTDTDAPTTNMNFVVAGNISREWVDSSISIWQLSIDFQEVQQ